jgi:hypothetical protein
MRGSTRAARAAAGAACLLALAVAAPADGQPGARPGPPGPVARPAAPAGDAVDADPLRCWWRSSAGAVRVGEPFSVVLTCAVVETDGVTAIPNEADLDQHSMQLPPFEVLGGSHPPDLHSAGRRFFQYEYRVRFIGDDAFGKDVKLPELKISYKVRSRVDGDALEGRDQTYVLPAAAIRVLSLVPAEATDIRDATLETFGDIDARATRATVLRTVGGVLFGFAAVAALFAGARLAGGTRRRSPAARALVSDGAILRGVGRELAAVDRERRGGGWTPALAARVLTALRILSAYALGLPPAPRPAAQANGAAGQLIVRGPGWRAARLVVPAWVTARIVAEGRGRKMPAARAAMLEQLEDALARLTAAQYGRDATADEAVLDGALALGTTALRRLKLDAIGPLKRIRAIRDGVVRTESSA